MVSPLEKSWRDPDSKKAKILTSARQIFGEYGYHGTTTRMIAKDVGIDISTLYYHWGEKSDLYEAVMLDINEGLRIKLIDVEKKVFGCSLSRRLEISIDEMTNYLFEHPEISNLTISRYFTKNRDKKILDFIVPDYISTIAFYMGLAEDKENASPEVMMKVLSIINSIYSFVSGMNFFLPMLGISQNNYIKESKKTLKFFIISAFSKTDEPLIIKTEKKTGG